MILLTNVTPINLVIFKKYWTKKQVEESHSRGYALLWTYTCYGNNNYWILWQCVPLGQSEGNEIAKIHTGCNCICNLIPSKNIQGPAEVRLECDWQGTWMSRTRWTAIWTFHLECHMVCFSVIMLHYSITCLWFCNKKGGIMCARPCIMKSEHN